MLSFCRSLLALGLFSLAILAHSAPFIEIEPHGAISDGRGTTKFEEGATGIEAGQASVALDALESALRTHGAYAAVLETAPLLISVTPESRKLHHMHALALAAAGQLDEARGILADWPPGEQDGWGALASALLARQQGALEQARMFADKALLIDESNPYAHQVAGTIALARNDLNTAEQQFQRAAELAPESALYHSNLGGARLQLDDLPGARSALSTSLALDPHSCPTLINLAALARATNELHEARRHLEACLETETGHPGAAVSLIEVLITQRDFDTARAALDRHATLLAEPRLLRARIALMQGDGSSAMSELRNAAPSDEATLLRAFAAGAQDDWRTAARLSDNAARQSPDDIAVAVASFGFAVAGNAQPPTVDDREFPPPVRSTIAFFSGLAAATAGDAIAMRDHLGRSDGMLSGVSIRGMDDAQLNRLIRSPAAPYLAGGLTYYAWQYYPVAARLFRKATDAEPELALAHILHALSAAQLGLNEETRGSLDTALRLAPASFSANLLRAEFALARGELEPALRLLERAAGTFAEPGVVFRIALVAEALGNDDQARTRYEQFVRQQPESYAGLNQLAWFLAARGESLDRALELAHRANEIQPGNASILDTIGWIHHLRGEHTAAVRHLRGAFEVAGLNQPLIAYHLAQAEMAAGNPGQARELLEQIVDAGPDAYEFSAEAIDLLQKLP